MKTFKDRLKELREAKGLSVKEMAVAVNRTESAAYLWESGKGMPTSAVITFLAKLLGCTEEYLLTGANVEPSGGGHLKNIDPVDVGLPNPAIAKPAILPKPAIAKQNTLPTTGTSITKQTTDTPKPAAEMPHSAAQPTSPYHGVNIKDGRIFLDHFELRSVKRYEVVGQSTERHVLRVEIYMPPLLETK